ncbi:MAG: septum formation inhibitor Maf [Gammaproteobacteria bacterium]|nr:septum formation inhibitor Maf [Gammaproteobacteria bacterium]
MFASPDIILASASPRRAELLQQIGVNFEVCVSDIDEQPRLGEAPRDTVCRFAIEKASSVLRTLRAQGGGQLPVLGADTIVVVNGDVLGKPIDHDDAQQMLSRLSNHWHEVLTAVAVVGEVVDTGKITVELLCNVTRVHMRVLTSAEIEGYSRYEKVMDKAGGYAVQGIAASFIDRIEGSYSAVMGLPLYETSELLRRFGINILTPGESGSKKTNNE